MLSEIRNKSISQLQEQHKLQECKPAPTEYLARALPTGLQHHGLFPELLSTGSALAASSHSSLSGTFPNGRQVSQQDNPTEAFIPCTWLTAIQNTQGCASIVGQRKKFPEASSQKHVKGILNQNTFSAK